MDENKLSPEQEREALMLTNDFMFKALFWYDKEKGKKFMDHFMHLFIDPTLKTKEFIGTELIPSGREGKTIRMDIVAETIDNRAVNLEIQIGNEELEERRLLYAARFFADQAKRGEPYKELRPRYSMFLLTKNARSKNVVQWMRMADKYDETNVSDLINSIVVQLNRVKEPHNEMEECCYFLKHYYPEVKDEIIERLLKKDFFRELSEVVMSIHDDEVLREIAYQRRKDYLDRISENQIQYERGLAEGKAEGKAEGLEEGIKTVAINLLKANANIEFIKQITGLSEQEINELTKE